MSGNPKSLRCAGSHLAPNSQLAEHDRPAPWTQWGAHRQPRSVGGDLVYCSVLAGYNWRHAMSDLELLDPNPVVPGRTHRRLPPFRRRDRRLGRFFSDSRPPHPVSRQARRSQTERSRRSRPGNLGDFGPPVAQIEARFHCSDAPRVGLRSRAPPRATDMIRRRRRRQHEPLTPELVSRLFDRAVSPAASIEREQNLAASMLRSQR